MNKWSEIPGQQVQRSIVTTKESSLWQLQETPLILQSNATSHGDQPGDDDVFIWFYWTFWTVKHVFFTEIDTGFKFTFPASQPSANLAICELIHRLYNFIQSITKYYFQEINFNYEIKKALFLV